MSRNRKRISSKGKALFTDNATVKADSTGRISTGPQTTAVIAVGIAAEAAARAAADAAEAASRAAADALIQAQISAFDNAANPPVMFFEDAQDCFVPMTGAAAVAQTARLAETVMLADAAGDTTMRVVLSSDPTGAQPLKTDAGITYDATNDTLDTIVTRSTYLFVYDEFSGNSGTLLFTPDANNGFDSVHAASSGFPFYDDSTQTLSSTVIAAVDSYAIGGSFHGNLIGTADLAKALVSGPPVFFPDDQQDQMIIPGPTGGVGPQGQQGTHGIDGQDGEEGLAIPGQQGAIGMSGDRGAPGSDGDPGDDGMFGQPGASIVGPQGLAGTHGVDGDPGEDGLTIPGQQGLKGDAGTPGSVGTQGIQGNPGADGEPAADDFIPLAGGAAFAQFAARAGSVVTTSVEVDFGAAPLVNAVFTITDATITTASRIFLQASGEAATGKDQDENEFDQFDFMVVPAAGTFDVFVRCLTGPFADKLKLAYQVA